MKGFTQNSAPDIQVDPLLLKIGATFNSDPDVLSLSGRSLASLLRACALGVQRITASYQEL